jgi:dGTPase
MEYKLAEYASNPSTSRGRMYATDFQSFRNDFQRDLNRITHSASFRRLEYKTQVFVNDKGDHYRTRLTHSIEVSQIGKVIAAALNLSVDLTEVVCLSHDLGHPPFGHAGEEALDEMMKNNGGFDHNANSLKLVTDQEERYFDFDGLNLTWETLEGIVKHNGPLQGKYSSHKKIPEIILDFNNKFDLQLDKFASLEAQVAAISDDIAYNAHDLEDGMRANLFDLDDLKKAGFMNDIIFSVERSLKGAQLQRVVHEVVRRVITLLVRDVITNSKKNIKSMKIEKISDVWNASQTIIGFSDKQKEFVKDLKKFLFANMYRHSYVNRMTYKARETVKSLFEVYINNLECLPGNWFNKISVEKIDPYIVVCDYIAGMTDRFASKEYEQLCLLRSKF